MAAMETEARQLLERAVASAVALANEPTVGLCYVQQHVRQSTPVTLALKDRVSAATASGELSREEAAELTGVVRAMHERGHKTADRVMQLISLCEPKLPMAGKASREAKARQQQQQQQQQRALTQKGSSSSAPVVGGADVISAAAALINLGLKMRAPTASQPTTTTKPGSTVQHSVVAPAPSGIGAEPGRPAAAEAKPAEVKPAEVQPAEAKPAEVALTSTAAETRQAAAPLLEIGGDAAESSAAPQSSTAPQASTPPQTSRAPQASTAPQESTALQASTAVQASAVTATSSAPLGQVCATAAGELAPAALAALSAPPTDVVESHAVRLDAGTATPAGAPIGAVEGRGTASHCGEVETSLGGSALASPQSDTWRRQQQQQQQQQQRGIGIAGGLRSFLGGFLGGQAGSSAGLTLGGLYSVQSGYGWGLRAEGKKAEPGERPSSGMPVEADTAVHEGKEREERRAKAEELARDYHILRSAQVTRLQQWLEEDEET